MLCCGFCGGVVQVDFTHIRQHHLSETKPIIVLILIAPKTEKQPRGMCLINRRINRINRVHILMHFLAHVRSLELYSWQVYYQSLGEYLVCQEMSTRLCIFWQWLTLYIKKPPLAEADRFIGWNISTCPFLCTLLGHVLLTWLTFNPITEKWQNAQIKRGVKLSIHF